VLVQGSRRATHLFEAVDAVLLHLGESQDFIPLRSMQQHRPIMDGGLTLARDAHFPPLPSVACVDHVCKSATDELIGPILPEHHQARYGS
jgi:hypothetical protein